MRPFEVGDIRGNQVSTRIDAATCKDQNPRSMKPPGRQITGFSLVEVALALGVAAICLLAILGLMPTTLNTQQNSVQQTTANQIISQITAVLRADVSLPPGQANKVCPDPPDPNEPCKWGDLSGHWLQVAAPDTMYFTNEGRQTGNLNGSPPADAVFRAKITYKLPPSETTSLADITVSWPAAVDPDPPNNGVPAGSVRTNIAVNR
jgi:type II secretory pathway pseudopilin PulG